MDRGLSSKRPKTKKTWTEGDWKFARFVERRIKSWDGYGQCGRLFWYKQFCPTLVSLCLQMLMTRWHSNSFMEFCYQYHGCAAVTVTPFPLNPSLLILSSEIQGNAEDTEQSEQHQVLIIFAWNGLTLDIFSLCSLKLLLHRPTLCHFQKHPLTGQAAPHIARVDTRARSKPVGQHGWYVGMLVSNATRLSWVWGSVRVEVIEDCGPVVDIFGTYIYVNRCIPRAVLTCLHP